ncbi:hypothetical protein GUJ93_ZPchr0013g37277 [Zizania palustris]|uniref:Uncharacterized protein n=1 Tax=Zizania palustris TaxID=103762 RepID=A0A8J5WUF3_ZIZPA|nr:hypothetical protein GUJ93_ZPchr0013g37277 [Zizania palustris]
MGMEGLAVSSLPKGIVPLPAQSATMPRQFFLCPFLPPSPAKHIKATTALRVMRSHIFAVKVIVKTKDSV